jgi:hypothetical protein
LLARGGASEQMRERERNPMKLRELEGSRASVILSGNVS